MEVKMVNIRKRGKVYQYQFEIAKVDGKQQMENENTLANQDSKPKMKH